MKFLIKSSREAYMFDADVRDLTAWYVASLFRKTVVLKDGCNRLTGSVRVGSHDEGEYIMDKLMEAVESNERTCSIDVANIPSVEDLKKTSGEEDG